MAEYVPAGAAAFGEGYNPNTQIAVLELHRLVCIFLASRSFADMRDGPTHQIDVIDRLQEHEEEEITRILLAVAITARVIDDVGKGWFDQAGTCGSLADDGVEVALKFREACNKIIHASKVRFDLEENASGQKYVTPTIFLYGQRNGKEWRAVLDVLAYAKQYVRCLPHY